MKVEKNPKYLYVYDMIKVERSWVCELKPKKPSYSNVYSTHYTTNPCLQEIFIESLSSDSGLGISSVNDHLVIRTAFTSFFS